jgi:glycine/D-amino acid oxidase-like deaminating enzyme
MLSPERKGVEIDEVRHDSLWASEAPMPQSPRLEGDREVELAIIGGGGTGLSCAYYAKKFRPDWSVIVLDSHGIGSGASSRNSGAVYAHHYGVDDASMARRGLDRLQRFIREEEIECDFRPAPTLQLFASKGVARRVRSDPPQDTKWVEPEELWESIRSEHYTGALDSTGYFTMHPGKLVAGHARAAMRVGAELFEHSPALEVRSGTPSEIVTPNGTIRAARVFLATNAHAPRLGFFGRYVIPVHQYSLATRKLTDAEITSVGLDRWPLRFELRVLPVTIGLTPGGQMFVRIVLGYASFNSCVWRNMEGARDYARRIFEQRHPWLADIGFAHGWHGVTGHTLRGREIVGVADGGNIHVSVAYNGLGVMPGHTNGYLTACRLAAREDEDIRHLDSISDQIRVPGELLRSMMFKSAMRMLTPMRSLSSHFIRQLKG